MSSSVYVLRDEAEGGLIGFCGCWFVYDELHINTLAVAKSIDGRDTRRGCCGLCSRKRRRPGITRATLEVRRSNEAALASVPSNLALKYAGIRPDYYTTPVEDALVLWSEKLGFLDSNPEP